MPPSGCNGDISLLQPSPRLPCSPPHRCSVGLVVNESMKTDWEAFQVTERLQAHKAVGPCLLRARHRRALFTRCTWPAPQFIGPSCVFFAKSASGSSGRHLVRSKELRALPPEMYHLTSSREGSRVNTLQYSIVAGEPDKTGRLPLVYRHG